MTTNKEMKVCDNCGAPYPIDALVCPYCGAEDAKLAHHEQTTYIKDLNQKKNELKRLPDQKANKAKSLVTKYWMIGILVFLCALLIFSFIQNQKTKHSGEVYQEHITTMEEYYNQGDYEKLNQYYQDHDLFGPSYKKYEIASYLYERMNHLDDEFTYFDALDLQNHEKSFILSEIYYILDMSHRVYDEIQESKENQFRYGEEDAINHFEGILNDYLSNTFQMNQEEIEQFILQEEIKEDDPLINNIMERIYAL